MLFVIGYLSGNFRPDLIGRPQGVLITSCSVQGDTWRCHGYTGVLTRLKKEFIGRHFSSDAEVIDAAETLLDGQSSDFFFEWLAKVRVWSLSLKSKLIYVLGNVCLKNVCAAAM